MCSRGRRLNFFTKFFLSAQNEYFCYSFCAMLDSIITSKTRLKLLLKFFVSATSKGYLRGIAEEFNESTNSIRKELNQLTEAGFLEKSAQQNKVLYHANKKHMLFKPLQHLMHSFLGIDNFVDAVLTRIGDVDRVSLVGSFANGLESDEIEVVILGENLDKEYLYFLAGKVKTKIGKNVVFYFDTIDNTDGQIVLYDASQ